MPFHIHQTRSRVQRAVCAIVASAAVTAAAQQTIFLDTFGTSSFNQTNIAGGIPGGGGVSRVSL